MLPFLLFSSAAGVLADWMSKQKLVIILKATEVAIMVLGVIAFAFKSDLASYALLFLLSTQSAVFGPPKYSIIPELVPSEKISKANGLITSFTYLAMIVGTFLASALTQITNRNFVLAASVCVLIAIVGYLAAICIPPTPKGSGRKKINPFFIYAIIKTLIGCRGKSHLLLAIFGSAFFLYVGAFFQLNMIPFAIQSLGLSEVGGGYLFLTTSIGIACGAAVAGKLCRERIELGLPCVALLAMTVLIFGVALFSFSLTMVLFCLITVGFTGGLFIVPLESFVQTNSPNKTRGQIVAAANFLSFIGVLMAPISIKVFNGTFHLSAAKSFALVGVIVALFAILMLSLLSHLFFNYLARTTLKPLIGLSVNHFPFQSEKPVAFIFPKFSWLYTFLLAGYHQNVHLYIPKPKRDWYDFLITQFTTVHYIYAENQEGIIRKYKQADKKNQIACLIYPDESLVDDALAIYKASIEKLSRREQRDRFLFKRQQIAITLNTLQ